MRSAKKNLSASRGRDKTPGPKGEAGRFNRGIDIGSGPRWEYADDLLPVSRIPAFEGGGTCYLLPANDVCKSFRQITLTIFG